MSTQPDTAPSSTQELDEQLASLLDVETFEPPADFREHALLNDAGVYEQAAADPQAWWVAQARTARLVSAVDARARRRRPALLQVVHRRHAERLLQLPRPPRHRRPWRPCGLPLARRGWLRARHHLRRAARRRRTLRQCAQGPGRAEGRRRRHLPADDSRGRRRHARLRAHRRAAQRRLRRLLRRGRARAHGVLRGKAVDHRRRRRAQGQDRARQGPRRRGHGRSDHAAEDRRRAQLRHPLSDATGARRLLRRDRRCRRPGLPARAAGRRASAVHPLHLRLHRQAQGHPAHHRRLPDRRLGHAPLRVRPAARVRRLLVRRRRRLGDRPLLHRLRPAGQRRHVGHVGGRARLPRQGHLVGDRRALRRDDPLLRSNRDSCLHQVGRGLAWKT